MRQMTMMWKRKTEQLLNGKGAAELLRYAVVGGLAFLVDFGVLVFCRERIFGNGEAGIYMSAFLGFAAGLAVNYFLSLWFVFAAARKNKRGRGGRDILIFIVVGVVGLGLTELGMYIGTDCLKIAYWLVKLPVTAAVMLWNYLGRKLLIFDKVSD